MTYSDANKASQENGFEIKEGDDFGAPDEKFLAKEGPIFITKLSSFNFEILPWRRPKTAWLCTNFNLLSQMSAKLLTARRESLTEQNQGKAEEVKINLGIQTGILIQEDTARSSWRIWSWN